MFGKQYRDEWTSQASDWSVLVTNSIPTTTKTPTISNGSEVPRIQFRPQYSLQPDAIDQSMLQFITVCIWLQTYSIYVIVFLFDQQLHLL